LLEDRDLTGRILGTAIEVHRTLGSGLLESAYEACLCHELAVRGVRFERQVPLVVQYKDTVVDCGYRLDLVVERRVILELKAVEQLLPLHEAQLMTYLKLSGKRIGLLINFNVERLRRGIIRRIL
jgi:GxxExxY protein